MWHGGLAGIGPDLRCPHIRGCYEERIYIRFTSRTSSGGMFNRLHKELCCDRRRSDAAGAVCLHNPLFYRVGGISRIQGYAT